MYHLCHITADCDVHNCYFDTYAEAEEFARVVLAEDGGTATIGTNGYSRTLWANDDGTCHVGGYDYSYEYARLDAEDNDDCVDWDRYNGVRRGINYPATMGR